ncbi:hypothetical protein H2204_009859 [Knufia peltigerae]|nr:hypothetical protein H2204_009859 [Knufia peltigerae]
MAYFQSLCLQAQVDFACGSPGRAQVQVALGLRLAQGLGMLVAEDSDRAHDEEDILRREVVWTLFMMDRIFIGQNISRPCIPASSFDLFVFERGPLLPERSTGFNSFVTLREIIHHHNNNRTFSLMAVNIHLLSIWEDMMRDVFETRSGRTDTFWHDGSSWSKIQSRLWEYEMLVHPHRYTSVGFPTRVRQDPLTRSYFLTWLFFQVLYSTIQCCLNHPFVLLMKTRLLLPRVPAMFLQKSFEYAMTNSKWVIRLVVELEEAGLSYHDPFLGYLLGIAATIQLEQTVSKKRHVASNARRNFEKARSFIRQLSRQWPNMLNLSNLLDQLTARLRQRQTMDYVDGEYDGAVPPLGVRDVALEQEDIDLMWKIFDYASVSAIPTALRAGEGRESLGSTSSPTPLAQDAELGDMQHWSAGSLDNSDMLRGTEDVYLGASGDLDFGQPYSDEWSLFGKPWSAYFPPDASPSTPTYRPH